MMFYSDGDISIFMPFVDIPVSLGHPFQRLEHFLAQTSTQAASLLFQELTHREHDILKLIAQGLTNGAIAERLSLSPKTVRNQVSIIFSKLHVVDRAGAIIKAREAGLG